MYAIRVFVKCKLEARGLVSRAVAFGYNPVLIIRRASATNERTGVNLVQLAACKILGLLSMLAKLATAEISLGWEPPVKSMLYLQLPIDHP